MIGNGGPRISDFEYFDVGGRAGKGGHKGVTS